MDLSSKRRKRREKGLETLIKLSEESDFNELFDDILISTNEHIIKLYLDSNRVGLGVNAQSETKLKDFLSKYNLEDIEDLIMLFATILILYHRVIIDREEKIEEIDGKEVNPVLINKIIDNLKKHALFDVLTAEQERNLYTVQKVKGRKTSFLNTQLYQIQMVFDHKIKKKKVIELELQEFEIKALIQTLRTLIEKGDVEY